MKNLKKSLCLVLALVMVLGLCTMGVGAEFSDSANIKYTDAATVMAGLGIIKGDDNDGDGNMEFRPTDNVTRAEAAKMITYMILGANNAEKLAAKQSFDDVLATHWAAKYIYYCQVKGIIGGYGDGNFGPSDKVTGEQLAKMLLVACGYGAMGEYVGAGWDVNATTDAMTFGIYGESTATPSDPATREEAALYVFNTLSGLVHVAWDVNKNVYDNIEILVNGIKEYKTFGNSVWNLAFAKGGNVSGVYTPRVLSENQATGAKYTVVDGVNYKVETGLNVIGHDVKVYYSDKEKTDADGVPYYDAYLVADNSTVVALAFGQSDADIAKATGSTKASTKIAFKDIPVWTNYVETAADFSSIYGEESENSTYYDKVKDFTVVKNLTGNFVLNAAGIIMNYQNTTFDVVKVRAVNGSAITLTNGMELTKYVPGNTDGGNYYISAYEGIAKGDYVSLQYIGGLYQLVASTTETIIVGDITNFFGSMYFNGGLFGKGPSSAKSQAAYVSDDAVAAADVKTGDTIVLHKDYKGGYFGIDLVTAGVSQGYVFFVDSYVVTNRDAYGNAYDITYAQYVDATGKEVNMPLGNTIPPTTGVYKLSTQTKSSVVYDGVTVKDVTLATFASDVNITNAYAVAIDSDDTKIGGARLTDDSKFFYVTGSGSSLKIEEANTLVAAATKANYYVSKSSNGAYVVPVVWVTAAAPTVYADSYICVVNDTVNNIYNFSSTQKLVKNNNYYQFSAYIEGAPNYSILVKSVDDSDCTGYLPVGFYKYSVDSNGLYTLKSTVATEYDVADLDYSESTYNNLFGYLLSINNSENGTANKFDDVNISKFVVKDLSAAIDDNTGKYFAANSVDQLLDLYADGYKITITYAMKTVSGNKVPTGALYITDIVAPDD